MAKRRQLNITIKRQDYSGSSSRRLRCRPLEKSQKSRCGKFGMPTHMEVNRLHVDLKRDDQVGQAKVPFADYTAM
ncbi:hypothetical protein MYX84_11090 [Acidobacteria bacterium AH-259-O06]|nr:hypothetical protein [Acidobacteria bacterium AH-259-O06]